VGIREYECAGESAQDDVTELDAAGRDSITQSEIIFTQEFGEVMQEDKEKAKRSPV